MNLPSCISSPLYPEAIFPLIVNFVTITFSKDKMGIIPYIDTPLLHGSLRGWTTCEHTYKTSHRHYMQMLKLTELIEIILNTV